MQTNKIMRAAPIDALPGFVDWQLLTYRFGDTMLTLQSLRFDAARFEPRAFAVAAIALPPAIATSVRKRQAEYFYGRLAARLALEHAGLPLLGVGTGTQRQPLWPAGVVGSITHNARHALAAALPLGPCRGIGIDIETLATPEQESSIASIALDGAERRILAAQAATLSPAAALTLVFSAKESFYKAVHARVGRFFGFEALRLTQVDYEGGRLLFTVAEPLSEQWQPGTPCTVHFHALPDGDFLTACVW
jgi:4'-phosphopantetheinyl transferase EntD